MSYKGYKNLGYCKSCNSSMMFSTNKCILCDTNKTVAINRIQNILQNFNDELNSIEQHTITNGWIMPQNKKYVNTRYINTL